MAGKGRQSRPKAAAAPGASPTSAPASAPTPSPLMIQIDRPGQKLTRQDVHELLSETGVQLDPDYGPIVINRTAGRHVVRGVADEAARAKLGKLPGVRVFADPNQQVI